jgi:hypothetical protein
LFDRYLSCPSENDDSFVSVIVDVNVNVDVVLVLHHADQMRDSSCEPRRTRCPVVVGRRSSGAVLLVANVGTGGHTSQQIDLIVFESIIRICDDDL